MLVMYDPLYRRMISMKRYLPYYPLTSPFSRLVVSVMFHGLLPQDPD